MVRGRVAGAGQLAFDDCTPDRAVAEPKPRRQSAGTRYYPGVQSDLRGQRLHISSTSRIVTIPIRRGEYL